MIEVKDCKITFGEEHACISLTACLRYGEEPCPVSEAVCLERLGSYRRLKVALAEYVSELCWGHIPRPLPIERPILFAGNMNQLQISALVNHSAACERQYHRHSTGRRPTPSLRTHSRLMVHDGVPLMIARWQQRGRASRLAPH